MAGDKYLKQTGGTLTEVIANQASAGAGDAGKVVALDATGKLDTSMMPVGVAAATVTITASEALSAGDFVNIWNSTGAKVRKADGSTTGKAADGFVLSAVSNGNPALVYLPGEENTQVSGATPGPVWLSDTTPGGFMSTAPVGSGKTVQRLGAAAAATEIVFLPGPAITLA